MKVNYSLEESEEESESNDKIPKNISIRTMQSDLLRLKELAKGKSTEISTSASSQSYKKTVPPTDLPAEELKETKEDKENGEEKIAVGFSSPKKFSSKKKTKKIIFLVVLILILIGLTLLLFYWFNLKENIKEKNSSPLEQPEETKKNGLKAIVPKIPFVSKFIKPTIPIIPSSLIPIKETFIFDFSFEEEFNLVTVLENYLKTLKEVPKLALVEIKEENKILELEKLLQKIVIEIPEEIMVNLKDNYALIFFNFEDEHRLGLILEVDNLKRVQKNVKQWEAKMPNDLNGLFLETKIGRPSTIDFQENVYRGFKIRYLNFPESDITIDYVFVGNKLIITTSKKSIYNIIDILINEK